MRATDPATLSASRLRVEDAVGDGVSAVDSTVELVDSTLRGNRRGIRARGGQVDVDWSAVEDNVSVGIDVRGSGTVTVTNSDLTSNGSDAVVVVGGQGEPDVSVTSCNLDGNGLTANGTWVPLWWSVARGTHQELVETQNYVAPGGVPVETTSPGRRVMNRLT